MKKITTLSLSALVCAGLMLTGSVSAATAAPALSTQQESTVGFDIKPTAKSDTVQVQLSNGSTRDAGNFVEVLDTSGVVVERLPKSATVDGETVTYTATSATTLEVGLKSPTAGLSSAQAAPAQLARAAAVKWEDSYDKCVSEAALGGALAGALVGTVPGAVIGMIGAGTTAALLQCRGLPRM